MKKRITLLGIIVAVLSFLNIGSVSAYNPSQFDLVPEPVYNLLRKILVEFGVGPGESFIVFAKFVLFVVLFALFYYGTLKFFKQPRISTVISLGLALFSVILLPGTYVLKMAELYAGIVGIALPVLLIWLGFKMYKNFSHPVMKGIIDALSIMIVSSTMAAVQGGSDLPFLFETVKWFGLLQLFFMFMLVIHILEAFSWAAGQVGEGGSGGGSSLWDKVFGGGGDSSDSSTPAGKKVASTEKALEKKEEADLGRANKLLALEEKLDERVLVDIEYLEGQEYLQYKHLAQLLKIVAVMKQGVWDLKHATDAAYIKQGFAKFRDSFYKFHALLIKLIGEMKNSSRKFKSVIGVFGQEFNIDKHLIKEITGAEKQVIRMEKYMNKYNSLATSNSTVKAEVDKKSRAELDLLFDSLDKLKQLLPEIKSIRFRLFKDYENNVEVISNILKPIVDESKKLESILADLSARFYKTMTVGGVKVPFGRYGSWDTATNYLTMIEGRLKAVKDNSKKEYEDLDSVRLKIQKELKEFVKIRKEVIEAFKLIPRDVILKLR